jgi:PAS domain S-box-containing protein
MAETLEWRDAQLRESEFERTDALGKIAEIVDCVPEPFFVLDDSFSIRALNAEGSLLFGSREEELIGKSIRGLCPEFPAPGTTGLMGGNADLSGPQVRRFRTKTMPARASGAPVSVDISLTRISIAHQTYFMALMKRSPEAISDPL